MSIVEKFENKLLECFGKHIKTIDKESLNSFIKENYIEGYKYYTVAGNIKYVNAVLKKYGNENKITISDFDIAMESDGHITKKEIVEYVGMLENPQDKLILYGLFLGLYGKQGSDLLNLQEEQIDWKEKNIKVDGKNIKVDDRMLNIIRETLSESTYYVVDTGNAWNTSEVKLNMSSPYIIKQRPSTKNNNGLNAMTYNGLRTRFANLMKSLDCNLNINDIVRSGHIYRMSLDIKNPTIKQAEKWIKDNGIKGSSWKFSKVCCELYKK